jgi:MFS family permease
MTHMPDLDQIERRTWTRYAESGLTDILLGAILLASSAAAVGLRTDLPAPWPLAVYIALAVPCLLAFHWLKRMIVLPRLGRIRVGPRAKARRRKTTILGFVSVGVTVLLVLLTVGFQGRGFDGSRSEASLARLAAPGVMTASILLFFGLTAHILDYHRMYLIGILYAVGVGGIMLYVMEQFDAGIAAAAIAVAFILIMGTVTLVRWLRRHPIPLIAEERHAR